MIPWSTVCPVLISLFSGIAVDQITSPGGVHLPLETPEWKAAWKDRSVPMVHPLQKVALYLKVISTVQRGWDDIRWEELDTGLAAKQPATGVTNVFEGVAGLRKFVLNLQAWVPEDQDALHATAILDRVRTRLQYRTSTDQLLAVNVDLTDISGTRDMTATHDKRRWSIASMDVTLTCCINDNDPIPMGYIERIILTSHEKLAADTEVPDALRMLEETLPPLP